MAFCAVACPGDIWCSGAPPWHFPVKIVPKLAKLAISNCPQLVCPNTHSVPVKANFAQGYSDPMISSVTLFNRVFVSPMLHAPCSTPCSSLHCTSPSPSSVNSEQVFTPEFSSLTLLPSSRFSPQPSAFSLQLLQSSIHDIASYTDTPIHPSLPHIPLTRQFFAESTPVMPVVC